MAARRHISDSNDDGASHFDRAFRTTHWSLVLTAGDRHCANSRQALETLCRRYWMPLYFYVRRKGYDAESTEDLIQGFFTRLIEKDLLACVRQGKGRFRNFLITAVTYFVNDEWDKAHARKRGGGRTILSLDVEHAERLYHLACRAELSPDVMYERQWARTLLDNARQRLRASYVARGREGFYDRLEGFLSPGEEADHYAQAAADLGVTAEAARACVCRMRRKFRSLLRAEVAETVERPEQVEEELQNIRSIFQ